MPTHTSPGPCSWPHLPATSSMLRPAQAQMHKSAVNHSSGAGAREKGDARLLRKRGEGSSNCSPPITSWPGHASAPYFRSLPGTCKSQSPPQAAANTACICKTRSVAGSVGERDSKAKQQQLRSARSPGLPLRVAEAAGPAGASGCAASSSCPLRLPPVRLLVSSPRNPGHF